MRTLILARHAHAVSNAEGTVSGSPPGDGLSPTGLAEAGALAASLAGERIDYGVGTRFLRTQQTLARALGSRPVPIAVEPLLDEIGFGSFEGGPIAAYRDWAWAHSPEAPCPGGGESRAAAAARVAAALRKLVARPDDTVLAISHALALRYVLDAADGRPPSVRVEPVPHAVAFRLERAAVERAAEALFAWSAAPVFADTPFGG